MDFGLWTVYITNLVGKKTTTSDRCLEWQMNLVDAHMGIYGALGTCYSTYMLCYNLGEARIYPGDVRYLGSVCCCWWDLRRDQGRSKKESLEKKKTEKRKGKRELRLVIATTAANAANAAILLLYTAANAATATASMHAYMHPTAAAQVTYHEHATYGALRLNEAGSSSGSGQGTWRLGYPLFFRPCSSVARNFGVLLLSGLNWWAAYWPAYWPALSLTSANHLPLPTNRVLGGKYGCRCYCEM